MTAIATTTGAIRQDRDQERLVWSPPVEGRRLDGTWRPRSRDAVTELSELIPLVSEHLRGPVTRVSLNIDAWGPDHPRRLRIGDETVRVGWFHTIDASTITLGRGTFDRVTLVIIPWPADVEPERTRWGALDDISKRSRDDSTNH